MIKNKLSGIASRRHRFSPGLACTPRASRRGNLRSITGANGHIEASAVQHPYSHLPCSNAVRAVLNWVVRGRVELPTFRFSGERPGPHESTTVRLIRLDDLLGHLGVQNRPCASTTVVSTALAVDLCIRRP